MEGEGLVNTRLDSGGSTPLPLSHRWAPEDSVVIRAQQGEEDMGWRGRGTAEAAEVVSEPSGWLAMGPGAQLPPGRNGPSATGL